MPPYKAPSSCYPVTLPRTVQISWLCYSLSHILPHRLCLVINKECTENVLAPPSSTYKSSSSPQGSVTGAWWAAPLESFVIHKQTLLFIVLLVNNNKVIVMCRALMNNNHVFIVLRRTPEVNVLSRHKIKFRKQMFCFLVWPSNQLFFSKLNTVLAYAVRSKFSANCNIELL